MAHYRHDGHPYDLGRSYCDAAGIEWAWTGQWTDGEFPEPLMQSTYRGRFDRDTPVPLPDLYRDHGALLPVKVPVTAEMRRAALVGFVAESGPSSYFLRGGAA
ncbi:phiSA1p31-related protein [Streptomyces sp. NBC_00237]|uniref:phiSA1p31-related protein n=1 Tax=Streptomyces sp. NBC_00237 TaxID=2975687 RepID=UPI00225AD610|nr:phiSA1p31-related protein [Streptomyces sp. NBC_00237]MCX5202416.1 phiSA1p31-related protein [Streptomyces sp. NBC_00237]